MLLLYRIHALLSSISGIVHFSEYDGLHKCQTFHTFRTSGMFQTFQTFQMSGMFQTFQTTQPPGFSAVVPIFQRQKVDHRRLYSASEKLKAIAYIAPAEEGRIHYIHYIYSIFPLFSHGSVQPKNKRTHSQTETRQATQQGHPWAQHAVSSRLQMRLERTLTRTEASPSQVTSRHFKRRLDAFLRLIDAFYDV